MTKKNKILIIDDDKTFANRLANMIDSLNYITKAVYTPEEAIETINKDDYDVCLVDLFFNGKERGIDLVGQMKKLSDQTGFIIVTAFGSIHTAISAVQSGADDYIAKGASGMVNIDQLEMAINSSLVKQHLRKELFLSNKVFESLHSLSLIISEKNDSFKTICQKICKIAFEILDVDFVAISIKSDDNNLILLNTYPLPSQLNQIDSFLNLLKKEVIEKNKVYAFNEIDSKPDLHKNFFTNRENLMNLISIPIHSNDDELVGVLSAGSATQTPMYSFAQKLLDIFAQRIATEFSKFSHIKERKKIYEQLANAQKLDAVSSLAGGVAHDFNNILCIILTNAQLLKDKFDNDFVQKTISTIQEAGMRGENLVRKLTNTVRVEVGELKSVNINEVLKLVYSLIKGASTNGLIVKLEINDTEKLIYGNQSQIEHVLINLSINAFDVLKDGGKLILSAENIVVGEKTLIKDMKPGKYIKVSVEDTGTGIDNETLSHIFEPFFTTKNKTNGTGLGLTLVHNAVKEHNGHINVTTKLGVGTKFDLYFPEFENSKKADKTEDKNNKTDSKTSSVLIVDDDNSLRQTISSIMEISSLKPIEASNGKEACEIYEKQKNDICFVVLDMIMPIMGGHETFIKLKEINPDVKVVIISGYSENDEVLEILDNGAVGFLHKPFKIKELIDIIKNNSCNH